jgi:hypothetical protein
MIETFFGSEDEERELLPRTVEGASQYDFGSEVQAPVGGFTV